MLTNLPVELITRVFESLESFDDSTSLARCSKFLAAIYTNNKPSIRFSILPHDPVVNGPTLSLYPSAAALFRAQRQTETSSAADSQCSTPTETATLQTTTVNTILHNAHIINLMATGISTNISSQLNDKRYDDSDRGVFSIHGNELLRHALYLIWLLLCCKQTIPRRYYHGAPRPLRHPDNDIVTSDFCRYLRTWQGHKHWILRKAESVVPQESRRAMLTKDIVETVITACHDRKSELGFGEMIAGFRTVAVTVDDSKASKVELIPTVKKLKERVAALEKAEGELKGQVKDLVKANKELEEQVRKAEEREAGWKMRVKATETVQQSVAEEVQAMKRMWGSRFRDF